MKTTIPILILALSFAMAGCTTTQSGGQESPLPKDTIVLLGDIPNFYKYMFTRDCNVRLTDINGSPVEERDFAGNATKSESTPGLKRVAVSVSSNRYTEGETIIEFEAVEGHTYKIKVMCEKDHATKFNLQVIDVTQKEPNVVLTHSFYGRDTPAPITIPIIL